MAKAKKKILKKSKGTAKSKSAKPVKAVKSTKAAKASKAKPLKKATRKAATASKTKATAKKMKSVSRASSGRPAAKVVDISQFVTPLDDRVIVQVNRQERVTSGGLIIPDTVGFSEGYREGIVLAVGRGHQDQKGRLRPMDVKNGDRVLFSEYAGSKLQYQNEELLILRESDVMGVVS